MAGRTVRYTTGGGVVLKDDQVLLLDRPQRSEIRLPKGHVDPGEAPMETAIRETGEETGYIDLEILADLGQTLVEFENKGKSFSRTEYYYLMVLKSKRQRKRPEHDRLQFRPFWRSIEAGLHLLTFQEERAVLQKAWAVQRRLALKDSP